MKTIASLMGLLCGVELACAQAFRAMLTTPQEPSITGVAAFEVNGNSVNFTISFTLEGVVPTNAVIAGPQSEFAFDLGQAFIVFHSPGPWPNGYDGSTAFFGSFDLPSNLREDLAAERTTLQLTGSSRGDFSGPILAALPPQIATLNFQGTNLQLQFMAQAPYQYTVEYSESLGGTSSGELTAIPALSQTFEAVVTDSSMGVQTRFYRVRRELCCQ